MVSVRWVGGSVGRLSMNLWKTCRWVGGGPVGGSVQDLSMGRLSLVGGFVIRLAFHNVLVWWMVHMLLLKQSVVSKLLFRRNNRV